MFDLCVVVVSMMVDGVGCVLCVVVGCLCWLVVDDCLLFRVGVGWLLIVGVCVVECSC